MDVKIEPLKQEDINDFVKTFWTAFEPLEANMPHPMIYRNGLSLELVERYRDRILKSTKNDPAAHCFCARDKSSNNILGVSWWDMVENPPRTKAEMDTAFEQAAQSRYEVPSTAGTNEELDRAFFKARLYSEMEATATCDQGYVTCKTLAVLPSSQRLGIGSLLLKHGLLKADELGLPVYLDASVSGRPLYERYGFKVVRDVPMNFLDYGGRSDGRHTSMLRPAQTADLNGSK